MNRTRAPTALLLPLILAGALRAQARIQSEPVPHIVLVKFTPDALPEIAQRIYTDDLVAPQAHSLLQTVGFAEGRKIFEDFYPADTLALHRTTGELVTLRDLSRWYVLHVPDADDVEALALQLATLPGVEAASPSYAGVTQDVFPNDDLFESGSQWGLYNFSTPGRDIHAPVRNRRWSACGADDLP